MHLRSYAFFTYTKLLDPFALLDYTKRWVLRDERRDMKALITKFIINITRFVELEVYAGEKLGCVQYRWEILLILGPH